MSKKSQLKNEKKKVSIIADYQRVFEGPIGQKVLLDLMQNHYITKPLFNENALEMAAREGERNVVLRILTLLNVDTASMFKKLEEIERNAQEDEE